MGARKATLCIVAALTVLTLPACNGSSGGGVPVVTIAGQALVMLGTQAQLTASTTNGTDATFVWTSGNQVVATVDQTGMVTGRAAGEATITATGDQTGKSGTFQVVVSADPTMGVPNLDKWSMSPHADQTAEAFRHWDDDGEIPTSCAKCHSTHGFRDFLGDDGSTEGVVDQPAALGTTIECVACHNEKAELLDSVTFPSGVTIPNSFAEEPLGREAVCMSCHQGRQSSDSVDDAITTAAVATDDTVMPDQGFLNVHYFPAGATRYGGQVRGGYLYEGKHYDVLFRHVPGLEACQDCHDPHTQQIMLDVCAQCHNVSVMEDLYDIRMESSLTRDYDGDGNLIEGLWFEINGEDGLRDMLLDAIQAYAAEVIGSPIIYDGDRYPYFFNDTNGNGEVDGGENIFPNRYTTFTPRLLRATFNYQYATKDPGGFAHNGKFIIQLLHDAIGDLNGAITTPIDLSNAVRDDVGHFDGTAEAFRHWDDDGEVSANCARCHGASHGLDEYLTYETNTPKPIANGFDCAVCHTTFDTFETRRIETVTFPSGLTITVDDSLDDDAPEVQSQICITCHQGRVSKKSIDDAIASGAGLRFQNVHYLAAGATLFGTEVKVGYEYDGKDYVAKFDHFGEGTQSHHCVFCHSPNNTQHTFHPQDNLAFCKNCHDVDDVKDIRLSSTDDYDGDGDATERLSDEVDTMAAVLLKAIQDYARDTLGKPVVYSPDRYPYFFNDLSDPPNGVVDPGEAIFPNQFRDWDGTLLKAAHNYQHSQKEPGAWAHNFAYIAQLVYDSIEDLTGDTPQNPDTMTDFIRPPVD